ncbi:penicillin-binding protein 1C [Stappia indica]|uniref:penicillin-binding protein 1C n=1 Tax=Stappia indica TaxID=538381 RepID=UPI001CD809B7|nr:penicillin-binding protein 1C [Stappia indica]MCA1297252.1 penicillin-binding protein 1C [Stappia indica]
MTRSGASGGATGGTGGDLPARSPNGPVRRRRALRLATFVLGGGLLAAGVAAGALAYAVHVAEVPGSVRPVAVSRSVLDREGVLLRAFQTPDDRWRLPLEPDEVDPLFLRMLLAYEDRRFEEHAGVDPRALIRAAGQAVWQGRIVSGASTLTMQTARLLAETPTRSLIAKWRQVASALALERRFSKHEILTLYLLRAPYGGNIEGLRAASLTWFGKEPKRLTPAESALLVALPQAPEARRPDRHPKAARQARDRVLEAMVSAGVLAPDEAAAARRDPVPRQRRAVPMLAAHSARDALVAAPGAETVRLTIDSRVQARLEALAEERARRLGGKVSLAILVADHGSGEVLARVGSPGLLSEARLGHVDMTRALRSPGSTLKPLIYGLAFEEGIAHPGSLIEDRPTLLAGYSPTNFDRAFQGTVRVREALQASLNVPAVKLLDAVGVSRFVQRLAASGAHPQYSTREAPGLAVALGGFGMTLEDLVALYAGFARGGKAVVLRERSDPPPAVGEARATGSGRILAPAAAWYVGDILSEVPPPDAARGEGVAYKTGTSYGYRDAWAVGYDGRHVIGVWVGRADGTPVPGITGFRTAAPVLFEAFQRVAPARTRLPAPPPGVQAETSEHAPGALRYARTSDRRALLSEENGPDIFYPPDGAVVDLGLSEPDATGGEAVLVVKARRGRGPFTWMANGVPVARGPFATSLTFRPDGPGASTITVIDADGHADQVVVDIR